MFETSKFKMLLVKNATTAKKLTAKDAAFGIGRPATDDELAEYLNRCILSETLDLNRLIDETKA